MSLTPMSFAAWSSTRVAILTTLAVLVLGASAPALVTLPAQAATAQAMPWVSVSGPKAFSPNGDGRKDRAKFTVKVKKSSAVTVRVLRAGKVVRGPVKLGKRKAGATFSWTWNGKDAKGRRVADTAAGNGNDYQVKVVARSLKTQKKVSVSRAVVVDTDAGLSGDARLVADSTTVYPWTRVVHDRITFRIEGGAGWFDTATLVIRNSAGRVLREIPSNAWSGASYNRGPLNSRHVSWDGRAADGNPLDLGSSVRQVWKGDVTAHLRVEDEVGNVAQTPPITIHVSETPLVIRTAEATVAAQDTQIGYLRDTCGPGTGNGCGESDPCGTVVPSTRTDMPRGLPPLHRPGRALLQRRRFHQPVVDRTDVRGRLLRRQRVQGDVRLPRATALALSLLAAPGAATSHQRTTGGLPSTSTACPFTRARPPVAVRRAGG